MSETSEGKGRERSRCTSTWLLTLPDQHHTFASLLHHPSPSSQSSIKVYALSKLAHPCHDHAPHTPHHVLQGRRYGLIHADSTHARRLGSRHALAASRHSRLSASSLDIDDAPTSASGADHHWQLARYQDGRDQAGRSGAGGRTRWYLFQDLAACSRRGDQGGSACCQDGWSNSLDR